MLTTLESYRPSVAIQPFVRSLERNPVDGAALLSAHLPTVQDAIRFVCRQRKLSIDGSEELSSLVYLKSCSLTARSSGDFVERAAFEPF